MAFQERLTAMKAKQEAAEQAKREEAEGAAKAEKEIKLGELSAERERVSLELAAAEAEAQEADTAIAEAETFAAEQGENLDPEAGAEIEVLRQEIAAVKEKFENLKAEAGQIDSELAALGEGAEAPAEIEEQVPEEGVEGGVEGEAKIEMNKEEAMSVLTDKKLETISAELAHKQSEDKEATADLTDDEIDKLLLAFETTCETRRPAGSGETLREMTEMEEELSQRKLQSAMDILTRDKRMADRMAEIYIERDMPKFEDVKNNILQSRPEFAADPKRVEGLALESISNNLVEADSIISRLSLREKGESALKLARHLTENLTEIMKKAELSRQREEFADHARHYIDIVKNCEKAGADVSEFASEAVKFKEERPLDRRFGDALHYSGLEEKLEKS